MSNICASCGKCPRVGNRVSNANNKTKRWVKPNVHKMQYRFTGKASIKRGAICTKCVKGGKVEKVV